MLSPGMMNDAASKRTNSFVDDNASQYGYAAKSRVSYQGKRSKTG